MFSILKKHRITQKLLIQQVKKRIHLDFDPTKDYYKILGVESKASDKEIKDQYYKLAKKHHPDLNKGVSSDFFKEITAAYEILGDSEKRKKYDQMRSYSSGGFWNTSNNSGQQQQQSQYGNYGSRFYSQQTNYNSGFGQNRSSKMWQFTYTDPKTGQKKTFNFTDDAFKNFDDFISKMRSEMKTDFTKSEAYRQQEEKSRRDFFGNNYYNQNKDYFKSQGQQPHNNQDQQNTRKEDYYSDEFQRFNFNYNFFRRLNLFFLFGSIFMVFTFFSIIRRNRQIEQEMYYQQMGFPPGYPAPYNANPYYDPMTGSNPQQVYGNPYQDQFMAQPFRPINTRAVENPYDPHVPPRVR